MRMRILSSSSKPISSPGRTDKFPPPLMRFLRSNVSSRSRGRAPSKRRTPLFFRKKKNLITSSSSIEPTQEPSSPKVTCIGQVRVRRSKKTNNHSQNPPRRSNGRSKKAQELHCCFPKLDIFKCLKPKWPKCGWVNKVCCFFSCRSVKVRTAASSKNGGSSRFEEPQHDQPQPQVKPQPPPLHYEDDNDNENEVYVRGRRSSSATAADTATPPKNALLLTRCRSAPYRSSSLANRFWGQEEDEDAKNNANNYNNNDSSSRDSTASETRGDRGSSFSDDSNSNDNDKSVGVSAEELVESTAVKSGGESKRDDDENEEGKKEGERSSSTSCTTKGALLGFASPSTVLGHDAYKRSGALMLLRCKSEPARRGDVDKYDPQSSEFWRLRRLSNTQNSTPHATL